MNTVAQRTNLSAFLAGEVPLPRVFWLHGVVAGFAAGMALSGLGSVSTGLQRIWAVLVLVYLLAWYVALWRSAERYQGPAIWKWAARSVVALPFIGILLTVALSTGNGSSMEKAAPRPAAPAVSSQGQAPAAEAFQFDPSTARKVEEPK